MYIDVLIELKTKKLDKTFTYRVPSDLVSSVCVGKRVLVPFGKQKLEGFVLSINKKIDFDYKVKDIINIIDSEVVNNEIYD